MANLSEYLENENNIDEREFYTKESLKNIKLGIIKDTYFNSDGYKSITEYENIDDIIAAIRSHEIEGMLLDIATANDTQMFTNDLSLIGDTEDFLQFDYVGFGININNTDLQEKLTDIRNQTKALDDAIAKRKWLGINYDNRYIDRNLTGENGVLNIALKLKNHVYSYKQDNEYYGLDVEVLYDIARKHGYSLNFIEVDTYDEQIELLKNKTADIAAGYFVIRDDKKEEIAFTEILYPAFTFGVVRYENLEQSTEWDGFYDSVTDFNGEPLGILKGGGSKINLWKNHGMENS